ncbi:hypothetical protein RCL1_005487 [Eukaryota sp. TZLM3-RCL]
MTTSRPPPFFSTFQFEHHGAEADRFAADFPSHTFDLAAEPQNAKYSLSDFEWHRVIGTGTFGSVHLALHRPTQRWCAVKILNKMHIVNLKQTIHIVNEREILSRVQHPFIVNLFGTASTKRDIYLIMEFVNGGELFTYLRRQRRFSLEATRFYAAQIVLALETLHSHNIVYRDLKPEVCCFD